MRISITSLIFALLAQSLQARLARRSTEDGQLQRRAVSDLIPLGSASTYSIFALARISTTPGTVANGNIVQGDIGIAPASVTAMNGFGPVKEGASNTPFITGYIHAPPYTSDTPADVINAYTVAVGKSPFGAIGKGAGIIDGVTMTPGVYRWNGAIVLGAGKTLMLNGVCGDVFIFQSGAAIDIGANSKVVLIGGLTAASVYWVSPASVVTGIASDFSGIILARRNVAIAGTLVGAVYSQNEVILQQASIRIPATGLSTTSNSQGSISGLVCANCAPGSGLSVGVCQVCNFPFASVGGLAPCARCTGSNVVNAQGVCAPSAGTIATSSTTGYASQCSPGYFANGNMRACLICQAGSFGSGGIVSESNNACTLCAAGQHTLSDATGSTSISSCVSCAPNGISANAGARSCTVCLLGSLDGLTCSCAAGSFSTGPNTCQYCPLGSTTCTSTTISTECAAGFGVASTAPGQLCAQCIAGQWSLGGYAVCKSCPHGDTSTPGSTTSDSCTLIPLYYITAFMGSDTTTVYYLQNILSPLDSGDVMMTPDINTAMSIRQPSSFTSTTPIRLTATTSWQGKYFNMGLSSGFSHPATFTAAAYTQAYFSQCGIDDPSKGAFTTASEILLTTNTNCMSSVWLLGPLEAQGYPLSTSALDDNGDVVSCLQLYSGLPLKEERLVFFSCAALAKIVPDVYVKPQLYLTPV